MARPKVSVPKYCLHAPSGRAVVFVDRKPIYLGKYGTPESRRRYSEVIAQRAESPTVARQEAASLPDASVNDICLEFVKRKLPTYLNSDGSPSAERDCFFGVIKILRAKFGETPASEFGPVRLRLVRDVMVEKGWCRRFINKQVGRLRYIFRHAASWELVPEPIVATLRTVDALRPGDSSAPESPVRLAVPQEHIDAAKKHLRERNRDLVDLILLTAARPGEILALTTGLIERRGDVWVADFKKHKTSHRGQFRSLHFGAKAQAILLKYLEPFAPSEKLFPIQRKTFGVAVRNACEKAGVPIFTPHWLRHTAITRIANETDMESAQRVAGHSTAAMTLLYAQAARKKAAEAVKKMG